MAISLISSRTLANDLISNAKTNPEILAEVKEACGIDIGEPCQMVYDFLMNVLRPYLEDLDVDARKVIEKETMDYLKKNARSKYIQAFFRNGKLTSEFTHRLPDGSVKNLINRVLFNRTNGPTSASNSLTGKGLTDSAREGIYDRFKNLNVNADKHQSGKNWSRPIYRDNDFTKDDTNAPKGKKSGLAEFCRQVKEHRARVRK
jgi:hypothetical protein